MFRLGFVAALVCLLLLTGCDSSQPATGSGKGDSAEDGGDKPKPNPYGEVSFESGDAAAAALIEAAKANDHNKRKAIAVWLEAHGDGAVDPLVKAMNSSDDVRVQVAASLALQHCGPPAFEPLVKATTDHPQEMVRVNAVKGVAAIQPPTPRTVDVLLDLLKHKDQRVQQAAINGLGSLGQKAERATDPLVAILNSQADEGLRNAARSALERVNPRKTFQD